MVADILIVEPEPSSTLSLHGALSSAGYNVQVIKPAVAQESIRHSRPALVIINLPGAGIAELDLCSQLSRRSVVPIIVIGSGDEARNGLAAFEAGADDYLSRPFNPLELVARVRAILRRTSSVRHSPDVSRVSLPASLLNHSGFVQV